MLEPGAAGSNSPNGSGAFAVRAPTVRTALAERLASLRGRWPQIVNIALLIAGLGVGQGSIFIVQTWLLAGGHFDLLAAFGTHYSFAVFGIILVDAGGSTILAREVARQSSGPAARDDLWRLFCETCAIRLVVALLVGAAAVGYAFGYASDAFSQWYVALALPGLLLWAANGLGLLDGLKLAGISGIAGSAAYATTAAGLGLAAGRSPDMAGAILGGAFTFGYLVTLVAHWIVLGQRGWLPRYRRLTRNGLVRSLRDGGALLFQTVPGQINMRVQLLLSAAYLGAETTALFVYARQVVTGATQIVGFTIRVEFPGLVEKLASGKHDLASIVRAQRLTLYCAVALTLGITSVAGIAASLPDFKLHRAAIVIAALAPTILSLSLAVMLIQGLAALGRYAVIAWTFTAGVVAAMLVSWLLVTQLGVYAFVVGEATFHAVAAYLVYRKLR